MSYRGIRALNRADSHQRSKHKLPLVGKRLRMSMTEALSYRLQAIKVDRHDHLSLASDNYTPAWDGTANGGEESGRVGDDGHSETHA